MTDQGTVYLLSHPLLQGLYKIGLTRNSVEDRVVSLRSTSLPLDFTCIHSCDSEYALQLEKYIHRRMKTNRVASNREFFSFASDDIAVESFEDCVARFSPREYSEVEVAALVRNGNTPSQQVKACGLKSLAQVSRATGVSPQRLDRWHKNEPLLFKIVLAGVLISTT